MMPIKEEYKCMTDVFRNGLSSLQHENDLVSDLTFVLKHQLPSEKKKKDLEFSAVGAMIKQQQKA